MPRTFSMLIHFFKELIEFSVYLKCSRDEPRIKKQKYKNRWNLIKSVYNIDYDIWSLFQQGNEHKNSIRNFGFSKLPLNDGKMSLVSQNKDLV